MATVRRKSVRKKPRDAAFRASEVQRDYRELLDRAKYRPVQVLDSDGTVLGVQRWDALVLGRRLRELAAQIAQFQAVYEHHDKDPAGSWANQTPFPWIDSLHADEVKEFASEIVSLLLDAAQREDLEELEGCLRAWRSTADTYRSPEILEQMTESFDAKNLAEVLPPSAYEVDQEAAG